MNIEAGQKRGSQQQQAKGKKKGALASILNRASVQQAGPPKKQQQLAILNSGVRSKDTFDLDMLLNQKKSTGFSPTKGGRYK